MGGTKYRLRRDVYESLMRTRNATAVNDQVRITGINRVTLWRIRRGDPPSLPYAMRISEVLDTPFEALFERVEG